MQKRVVQLIIVGILLLTVVSAQTNTTGTNTQNLDAVSKAYACLDSRITNSSRLSLQEVIFSAITLGNKHGLYDKLVNERKNPEGCWPKEGCTIKETAQAVLALDRMGVNSDNATNWILSKNKSAQELTWYLEIDVQQQKRATCTLKYKTENRDITIREDMRIEGEPGSCLAISPNGYWLEVRKNCYEQNIEISCNEDFITTLVFERSGTGTIFVIPETHSAASSGTTTETVSAQCLGTGAGCDYEGTLWATLALQKTGKSVGSFIPYLSALSEDKESLFPSAFLYILSGSNEEYSKITQSMIQQKYWKVSGTPYNQYYDSAIALIALTGTSASEAETSRNYYLTIQTKEGCWNSNNIRDTAFLLYAGWPRDAARVGGSSGGGSVPQACASSGYYCGAQMACLDAGGQVFSSYSCSGALVCCSKSLELKSCLELNGVSCASNQECTGSTASSKEGTCCLASCRNRIVDENVCESNGGSCQTSCLEGEEETSESCGISGGICCAVSKKNEGLPWVWIILFLILIILVILAILKRTELTIWWMKFRGNIKTEPVKPSPFGRIQNSGIGVPPGRPGYMPQRMPPPNYPTRNVTPARDKDMDETLRKLKEISDGK